ncbi:MAG: hypothetical protein V1760_01315, partial [Candidatus Peregrinibacteria bacterium]
QVTYHCPPRFPDPVVERIQVQAEQLFRLLGMRDFARFDGWLLKNGNLWFSDFNPISGMEQNSFLFQQSARVGMSHRDLLRYMVQNACRRHGIAFPGGKAVTQGGKRLPVNVIFGGKSAERQVSLMSGTNAWLKLRRSGKYDPKPYLLDTKGDVWRLPYAMTLNHTVEEIMATCQSARSDEARLQALKRRVVDKLSLREGDLTEPWFLPEKMDLPTFLSRSERVFIGLHGGMGEDGTLQKILEDRQIPFNGSGSEASRLCMNKYKTAEALQSLEKEGIFTAPKKIEKVSAFKGFRSVDYARYFKRLTQELEARHIIVKPHSDGCSAGIARLYSGKDIEKYMGFVKEHAAAIPQGVLKDQHGIIEMPSEPLQEVMFERFIVTDKIRVIGNRLKWEPKSHWIEITMALLGEKGGMRAFFPSITVALGNVLTLEEKFQGGTGVNITPPPQPFVKKSATAKAKKRMEQVAKTLGLAGYARIDAFMHVRTGELIIIEANTAPALTPSTVLFQQALAENPPLEPLAFLERISP